MIEWRAAMAVGHPVIDGDHRKLIELINRFETGGTDTAEQTLLGLRSYGRQHFAREERLQIAAHYPLAGAQQAAHRHLSAQVDRLLEQWRAASAADRPALVAEIAGLLRQWLIEHILQQDLQMRPYASRMPDR
jgi:hemerythrin